MSKGLNYEFKDIAQCTEEEKFDHKKAFMDELKNGYSDSVYSPIPNSSMENVSDYKLGQASVFDLDQIKLFEEMGMGLIRKKLVVSEKSVKDKDGTQSSSNEVRNLFVNTGLYVPRYFKNFKETKYRKQQEQKALKGGSELSSEDYKAINKALKEEGSFYAIDGNHTLRANTIFLDVDFKGGMLGLYTEYLSSPNSENLGKVSIEVERLVSILKKEFGKAPNRIMLSKNGLHFHYHLELSLGWTSKGVSHIYDLSEESQLMFLEKAGLTSLDDLEVSLWVNEYDKPKDKVCIKEFVKKKMELSLAKEGFDAMCSDVGTRQTRESGFYHTKNINFPHLIRPDFKNYCEDGYLTKSNVTLKMTKKEKDQIISEMKKADKANMAKLETSSETMVHLLGGELITIGRAGDSGGQQMTISEIRSQWDTLSYVKNNKLNCRLDFLEDMGYRSIGGAFITKSTADDTLLVNLVHHKAPLNSSGDEVRLYVYLSEDGQKRAKARKLNKEMHLAFSSEVKSMASAPNLRLILDGDDILKRVFSYDFLEKAVRIHPSLSSRGDIRLNRSGDFKEQFKQILDDNEIDRDFYTPLKEKDLYLLMEYISNVYSINYEKMSLNTMNKIIYQTYADSDDTSVRVYTGHKQNMSIYNDWVKAGSPNEIGKLSDYIGIRKDKDPEYYDYINITGEYLALGIAFRKNSHELSSKVEHGLTISSRHGNTGKTHIAKCLLKVMLDQFEGDGTRTDTYEKRVFDRFVASGNLHDLSEGDFLQRVSGVFLLIQEEAGADKVSKKSNNAHKEFLTAESIKARKAYGRDVDEVNFTHYTISATNETRTYHADAYQDNHRRELRWDLDWVTEGNSEYAWPLLPSEDATTPVYNKVISGESNKGLIDVKSIAKWFRLALGQALAEGIYGTHSRPDTKKIERRTFNMENGLPTGKMARVTSPEIPLKHHDILNKINKNFEQSNDLLKETVLNYLSTLPSDQNKFSFNEIHLAVSENLKYSSVKVNNNNLAIALKQLNLVKKEINHKSFYVFKDGSETNKFIETNLTYTSTNSDPLSALEDNKPLIDIEKIKAEIEAKVRAELEIKIRAEIEAQIRAELTASKVETPKVETPKVEFEYTIEKKEEITKQVDNVVEVCTTHFSLLSADEWKEIIVNRVPQAKSYLKTNTLIEALKTIAIPVNMLEKKGIRCKHNILKDLNL